MLMTRNNNPEPGVIVQDKDSGEHYHISWSNIVMDDEGDLFIPVIIKEVANRLGESEGKRHADDIIDALIVETMGELNEERGEALELAGVYVIGYHWAELPVA